jgi:hypothetical protein
MGKTGAPSEHDRDRESLWSLINFVSLPSVIISSAMLKKSKIRIPKPTNGQAEQVEPRTKEGTKSFGATNE